MKNRSRRARAPLLAILALAGAACFSAPKHEEQWYPGEVTVASDRLLWEVTRFSLEKGGYPVGSGMDPTALVATSGWKTSLAPFRGKGWRERAQVRYQRVAPGRYRVEVRVEKQLNMDVIKPLDLRYAKWEPAPDNLEAARILLERIKAWVGADA
jgi:hypothetical protein